LHHNFGAFNAFQFAFAGRRTRAKGKLFFSIISRPSSRQFVHHVFRNSEVIYYNYDLLSRNIAEHKHRDLHKIKNVR
jgi:hypothetical protein